MTLSVKTRSRFKGLDSYRAEDRFNFFGRDGDSERFAARILSSRFALLHARSGAGKTSLLQAKLAPDLEAMGWTVVVARPQRDPVRAVRDEVLKSLAPPPGAERRSIERACRLLAPQAVLATLTLTDLVSAFQRLLAAPDDGEGTRHDTLRELLSPIQATPPPADDETAAVEYYAQFTRFLGGGLKLADYLSHIAALCDRPQGVGAVHPSRAPSIEAVMASLEAADQGLYQGLLAALNDPAETLAGFFRRLFAVYGKWRPTLRLVLVFDQFEELFTQFGQADADETPQQGTGISLAPYTLRDRFFEELGDLYYSLFPQQIRLEDHAGAGAQSNASTGIDQGTVTEQPLPVCCVISMRQEFLAELDPIRRFAPDLDQWSFHLDRLTPATAQAVLVKATASTSRPFGEPLSNAIVTAMTHEGRYVEPAELQVVVSRLESEGETPAAALQTLGGVKRILDLFLAEFLDDARLESDQKADRDKVRIELLEILQSLVGARGKSPTPVPALVNAPFRIKSRREALLQLLVDGRMIRIEAKEGTLIAEVRHDFLIPRILRTVREELIENAEHGRFVSALAVLGLCLRTRRLLTWDEFEELAKNEGNIEWRERFIDGVPLEWTPAELMVRSALNFDNSLPAFRVEKVPGVAELSPAPTLSGYLRNFAGRLTSAAFTTANVPKDWQHEVLEHGQLLSLNVNPDAWPLSPAQLLVVIRSHVEWCTDETRPLIEYWTNRWKDEGRGNV